MWNLATCQKHVPNTQGVVVMPVLEERVHFDWTNIPRVSVGNPWAHIVSKVRK